MGENTTATKRDSKTGILNSIVTYFKTNLGILIAFLVLFLIMSFSAQNFFSNDNFLNILRTVSTNSYLAIGVMMAIMLAGIDLTGGSLLALSGCIAVLSMTNLHAPIWLAVLLGCLTGIIVGFLNGVIISYTGMHPFIVTLAMQSICRGAAYLVANGSPVSTSDDSFSQIGNGYLGPIPLPIIYMAAFLFLDFLLLNKTRIGRHVYAVGGNRTAAKYSGININKVQIMVYTISGFLAAFGGIVLASRMSSGQPAVGVGFETDAIAAAVLGGTSMFGGTGTVGGMFIGVLVIGVINNGLNLMHVNSFWQYVAKGAIILIAVYVDMYRSSKESKKLSKSRKSA
jgi:ribose transport system permease protein